MVIFDTNILIELYRGNEKTREVVLGLEEATFYISAITVAEFLVGARNKIRNECHPWPAQPLQYTADYGGYIKFIRQPIPKIQPKPQTQYP